ncbi:MAG: biosynthetic-type acetolactate synthase large subunit [Rectinemataceae bacterium]
MSDKMQTGAETLVEIMIEEGVEFVFGLPGGNAIPIYDALVGRKVKLVLTRHEQGAVHMADGYARATGKVGVALVTSGPGATNTVTGLFTALMDSIPLVVVCGQSPTPVLGLDAFQEADVSGLTYPCVKHSYLVKDVEDIPRVMREAFYIARSGRPGPVLIDMPKDISGASISELGPREFHLPGYSVPLSGEAGAIAKAAKLLKAARRPILLVGHGAAISGASREVRELVERMRIPAVSTLLGKGVLPESHELSLGMLGMHGTAYANKAMVACDLVMSVGSRWDDRIVGSYADFCRGAVKIHVDIDPAEMDKVVKVEVGIVGDAKTVLSQLLSLLERGDTEEWVRQVARWRREYPLAYRKEGKVRAQHVIEELRALAGDRAVFTTDVGQHQMWAAQYVGTEEARNWISSGGAGTMGFGFPAAIGAQLGRPGELVIAIVGDGGFQMTLSELATMRNLKLPVKIVVINNHYLGMVRQWQNMFYDERYSGVDLEGNPDFVKLAQSYGIKGYHITRPADVRRVLKAALEHDGPCLVDAEVEKHDNVFPMIPAGAPLRDMLLEPPRHKLEKPTGGT